ncbi:MAG TPA: 2-C-methyl-D-erythritol 4-phosphate cytidylyltransferase [Armatimonadota bacterium]|jgi:2-C-methyl-D-erythritol 4-phosphate cytidylyltransferase/2-C-methyl-D-erythritol 2,4-cyclodiphosphate synthase
MDDVTAIVPAAGRGTRFGAARNKALAPLLGRPILRWTLDALAASSHIHRLVVAVSEEDEAEISELCNGLPLPWLLVRGGAARQDSVERALEAVETPIVAVHDAARPLVTPDIVARCIESVRSCGTGLAAIPVADTLKRESAGDSRETVAREGLWAAQTPQCFTADLLRRGFAASRGLSVTDDASVVEALGHPVRLVLGSAHNIKITTPEDLALAEAILRARGGQEARVTVPRIGYGYDVHRFQNGRRMVLGGVDFGLEYGLLGHSDADAVLHAVMDALLGAAGMPDIGHLFPNTDERWRGASSMDLLRDVADRIRAAGYAPGNVDITVIAERPKIGPHAAEMKANIAAALNLDPSAVGLKATTAEGLGDLGEGLGLAAHAVCLLTPRRI